MANLWPLPAMAFQIPKSPTKDKLQKHKATNRKNHIYIWSNYNDLTRVLGPQKVVNSKGNGTPYFILGSWNIIPFGHIYSVFWVYKLLYTFKNSYSWAVKIIRSSLAFANPFLRVWGAIYMGVTQVPTSCSTIPKTNSSPLKIGLSPKWKDHLPNINL